MLSGVVSTMFAMLVYIVDVRLVKVKGWSLRGQNTEARHEPKRTPKSDGRPAYTKALALPKQIWAG